MNKRVAIIGVGTQGSMIAFRNALYGKEVTAFSRNESSREKCRARIARFVQFYVDEGRLTAEEAAALTARISYVDTLEKAVEKSVLILNAGAEEPLVLVKEADLQSDGSYTEYDWLSQSGIWDLDPYTGNPVAAMVYSSRGNNESHNYGLNMSANLRIQPIKGLIWKSQFNYKMSSYTYRQYGLSYKLTNYAFSDVDNVSQSAGAGWNWSWENTVNYVFTLGDRHNFDALIGNTLEHSGFGEDVGAGNSSVLWPNQWKYAYVSNTSGDPSLTDVSGSTWGDSGLVSFFGRINYNYDERYMLSLILRHDGSSNFMRGRRWGTFPSVSAGWVVSNESWWNRNFRNYTT